MAGLQFNAQSTEIVLVTATRKTLMQAVAPANQRVKLLGWSVFFIGISPTAQSVQVRLLRQSTAGTITNTTALNLNEPELTETVQTVVKDTATAEPTAGAILESIEVHPQQGYQILYPYGQEKWIGGAGRLAIDALAQAGVSVSVNMVMEE